MMKQRKEHLTNEGIQEIVNIRATLNRGLSDVLKAAFPDTCPVERSIISCEIPDPNWLAGFTSAEGCFLIDISKSSRYKLGFNVKLTFELAQHIRDAQLMQTLVSYLGCGQFNAKEDAGHFTVTKFSNIYAKIIPLFKQHSIVGVKALDFQDWCECAEIIKSKAHLTQEGLDEINKIRAGRNTKRIWSRSSLAKHPTNK